MRKRIAFLAILCLCAPAALSSAAAARTGAEIAKVFNAGITAYDAGDYSGAYKLWKSIEDEDVAAMRNLGILYRKGLGVKKDPGRAEEMFERAADAGLATAQADLADMLLKGEAGKPDPKRALPYLKSAAAANHPIAQYELAQMYESGGLVPRDVDVARQLYAEAGRHGMKEATDRLAVLGPPDKRLARSASLAPNIATSVNLLESLSGSSALARLPVLTTPGKTGIYSVQVGAFQDRAAAEATRAKFKTEAADHDFDVQAADLKEKGTWYRLRVIGFDDRAAAISFCENLRKDEGKNCFVAKEARDIVSLAPAANNRP
jgi:TPR repeat protein